METPKWESLEEERGSNIGSARLRVPGGWLIRSAVSTSYGCHVTQTFVQEDVSLSSSWIRKT
jgi:hypothetical protein